jgi:hypothetical protein
MWRTPANWSNIKELFEAPAPGSSGPDLGVCRAYVHFSSETSR